jgi:AraC-like DNA-binding protein
MNARLDRLSALLEGVAPVFNLLQTQQQNPADGDPLSPQGPSLAIVLRPTNADTPDQAASPAVTAPDLWVGTLATWRAWPTSRRTPDRPCICIQAQLTGPLGDLLMEEFSEPIEWVTNTHETALSAPIALILQEVSHPRCGQPSLLKSAGDILFIGILRHIVANPRPERPGLLHALADVRIARALVAMHQNPHLDWNLASLAQESGMSRTSFANTFKKAMDKTPRKYLVALRLAMARRALENGKTVKEAARLTGYRNPSSIARAFRHGA